MLKRGGILIGALVVVGAWMAPTLGAAPPMRATVSISCDRGTSHAGAVITVYDGPDRLHVADPVTVECGTDGDVAKRERVVTLLDFSADYAVIKPYTMTNGGEMVTCGGEGTLSLKLACTGSTGAGATVTVR